jgi:tetratricopeptide (TPR) repeat protein
MMTKKAKGKKARKKADQKLQNMPAAQLIQKGEALLAAGNYREAIQVLKIGHKKQQDNDQIRALLFRAYVFRENQLRRKGLVQEAEALQEQIMQHQPEPAQLSEADLLICLRSTSPDNAISLYSRFLSHHKPIHEAEVVLAGALLTCCDCQATAQLPDTALLMPDLPILEKSSRLMNEGQWEAALECLQPITRSSPLAAVKMLCRAMVCFYQNDDAGMQRALSMIPDVFPLCALVEKLKRRPESLAPLWQGRFISQEQLQSLVGTIKNADFAVTARNIKQIAQAIRPRDPRPAIEQLLCMLWPLVPAQGLDSYGFARMAAVVLPARAGKTMEAKFHFLEFDDPFEDTQTYIELLGEEFPDPVDRSMAASMVLSEAVARLSKLGIGSDVADLNPYGPDNTGDLPSNAFSRMQIALLEMILKAVELDPQNPQVYDLLTQLPRTSRKAKQLAEAGLLKMRDNLADDPRPCIALAGLYNEKNAFRKAEMCLRQAEQLAPHDEQVKEFRVLALLKSIDANLRRKKNHLVKPDLEKAESLCAKKTLAHVKARRIMFDIQQTGQMSLFDDRLQPEEKGRILAAIESHIAPLPAIQRLKTLAALQVDCDQNPETWSQPKKSSLKIAFRRQTDALDELTAKQIRDLLLPDTHSLSMPDGTLFWLTIFLDHYKEILHKLGNEDIPPVLNALVGAERTKQCLQEIRRRLKTAPEPFNHLLRFYHIVVRHISGQTPADLDSLAGLVEQVQPRHRELLRTASRRLSEFAGGSFKMALEHFNFEIPDEPFNFDIPDEPCNCPACSARRRAGHADEDGADVEESVIDLFDPDTDNAVTELINGLEELVDMAGLRGAPEKVLKKQRKVMMKDYQTRIMFGALAEFTAEINDELSREARILLFG